jgi:hypothetical protein
MRFFCLSLQIIAYQPRQSGRSRNTVGRPRHSLRNRARRPPLGRAGVFVASGKHAGRPPVFARRYRVGLFTLSKSRVHQDCRCQAVSRCSAGKGGGGSFCVVTAASDPLQRRSPGRRDLRSSPAFPHRRSASKFAEHVSGRSAWIAQGAKSHDATLADLGSEHAGDDTSLVALCNLIQPRSRARGEMTFGGSVVGPPETSGPRTRRDDDGATVSS